MLKSFAIWLSGTAASSAIQNAGWLIPMIQVVHILAIAMVLSSVVMIDLRIFGMAGVRTTVSDTARRYTPWIWGALIVLAMTGSVLIIGEPKRSLVNSVFYLKMGLLVCAIAATAGFQATVRRNARFWDLAPGHGPIAKALAVLTLVLWFAIAVAGRWIAYTVDPTFV